MSRILIVCAAILCVFPVRAPAGTALYKVTVDDSGAETLHVEDHSGDIRRRSPAGMA
jgi:hypothetical protein